MTFRCSCIRAVHVVGAPNRAAWRRGSSIAGLWRCAVSVDLGQSVERLADTVLLAQEELAAGAPGNRVWLDAFRHSYGPFITALAPQVSARAQIAALGSATPGYDAMVVTAEVCETAFGGELANAAVLVSVLAGMVADLSGGTVAELLRNAVDGARMTMTTKETDQ